MFSTDTNYVNYFLLDDCDNLEMKIQRIDIFAQCFWTKYITQHNFHTKAGYILYIPLLWFIIVI